MDPQLGHGNPVQRRVELPVASAVEPVTVGGSGGRWDRRRPHVAGEVAFGREARHLGGLGDDLGGREGRTSGDLEQRRGVGLHEGGDLSLELVRAHRDSRQRATSSRQILTATEGSMASNSSRSRTIAGSVSRNSRFAFLEGVIASTGGGWVMLRRVCELQDMLPRGGPPTALAADKPAPRLVRADPDHARPHAAGPPRLPVG